MMMTLSHVLSVIQYSALRVIQCDTVPTAQIQYTANTTGLYTALILAPTCYGA